MNKRIELLKEMVEDLQRYDVAFKIGRITERDRDRMFELVISETMRREREMLVKTLMLAKRKGATTYEGLAKAIELIKSEP